MNIIFSRRFVNVACGSDEFLRDGDQMATHLTGVLKMGGKDITFESFVFAKVDTQSGKIKSMVERAVM